MSDRVYLKVVARLVAEGRGYGQWVRRQRVDPDAKLPTGSQGEIQARQIRLRKILDRTSGWVVYLYYAPGDLSDKAPRFQTLLCGHLPTACQELVRPVGGHAFPVDQEKLLLQSYASLRRFQNLPAPDTITP